MTNIISNYPTSAYHALPSCSSTSAETTKLPPSSSAEAQPAYLHDDCDKVFLHVMVCVTMSVFFAISASAIWQDRHDVIIDAIVHLYSIVMIHLVLIRHLLTSMLMLVATGIVLISLAVAVYIFRPDWPDLVSISIMVLVSTAGMFCLLGAEENSRKKPISAKYEDVSNRV